MRRLSATMEKSTPAKVHRLLRLDDLAPEWREDLLFLIHTTCEREIEQVQQLNLAGLRNVRWLMGDGFQPGDVVLPNATKGRADVLYRESDLHHGLLLTNRCNSYCLMCSQPPTKSPDGWLVDEAFDVIRHFRTSPISLGLSGGEPLLLGADLRRVLDMQHHLHPSTQLAVLTNGRLFSQRTVVDQVLTNLNARVSWLVPLYGHADFLHDFVVQSPGAFDETIGGLLALQENAQSIQLRIVLIEPVLQNLEEICSFIGRNLAFVNEVALMACEPIGFALANREACEVDLGEWESTLLRSSNILKRFSIPYLFMNTPMCALPAQLRPHAHRSISDWKNTYADECDRCSVKGKCCGLFTWHERGWKPTKLHAIEGVTA